MGCRSAAGGGARGAYLQGAPVGDGRGAGRRRRRHVGNYLLKLSKLLIRYIIGEDYYLRRNVKCLNSAL